MAMMDTIAIIDLGGQYCHLISRRLREFGVGSQVYEPDTPVAVLKRHAGIILSGGPQSVYEKESPKLDPRLLQLNIPVLGICYGHQLLAHMLGARVERGSSEYGATKLTVVTNDGIFKHTKRKQTVWMSHMDTVTELPAGFRKLASTKQCQNAAFADLTRRLYGVQFHPEVAHTQFGKEILRDFVTSVCGLKTRDNVRFQINQLIDSIGHQVGQKSVFFLVSGGVDSTVAFTLCAKALPKDRILGLYVDTGLMRKKETEELRRNLRRLGLLDRLKTRDESALFFRHLRDTTDPEEKRQIIGRLFVEIQSQAMRDFGIDDRHWLLGQGTIYPDTIESGGMRGRAAVIKTHHNRCPEIREMIEKGRVIEPLAEFYKDEVRRLGKQVGLSLKLTNSWPFPGPGLAIRCLCVRTPEAAREVSTTLRSVMTRCHYEGVVLPIRSVGVQGDARTYKHVVALQAYGKKLEYESLQFLSTKICNVHTPTNRVIVFITGAANKLGDACIKPAALTKHRIELLREADFIVRTMMDKARWTERVWQFPVVLVPICFGSGESIILRPVDSEDGMTANFSRLPLNLLYKIAEQINQLRGIDAVFLDVTSKPPATIEWE